MPDLGKITTKSNNFLKRKHVPAKEIFDKFNNRCYPTCRGKETRLDSQEKFLIMKAKEVWFIEVFDYPGL